MIEANCCSKPLENLVTNFLSKFPLREIDPGFGQRHKELDQVVDDFHTTEDGKAGEEPHGAPDEAELGLQGHLIIVSLKRLN